MAKYKITAPDGRVVTVSGDTEPTEADAQQIFAALPPVEQPKPKKMGTLDTTNALLEETARGVPVVGAAFDPFMAGWDATNDYILTKLGARVLPKDNKESWREWYDYELNKKKNAAAAFQQANPYKSMGASFAGGALLPLGAAGKANTLVEAMGNAAKVGIPLGAVDAGLRKSGDLGDKIQASVQGGAEGGIGAALFGGAGYGVGRAGAKISPIAQRILERITSRGTEQPKTPELSRAYKELVRVLGRENAEKVINTARERGVPLIDLGDANVNQLARTARSISPDANEAITTRFNTAKENTPSRVTAKLNEIFGTENSATHAERIAAALDPEANTLYEMAFMGNTTVVPGTGRSYTARARLPKDAFAKLDKNPYIRDAINTAPSIHKELQVSGRRAIKDANGKVTGYEAAPAERNDMRRLDFAKEVLDNQIAREKAAPAPNTRLIASLTNAKQDLVTTMDNFSPLYKQARAVSGKKLSANAAREYGAKIDRNDISADTFIKSISEMSPTELDAARVGARDFYMSGFEKNNPAVFAKRLLDTDAQRKIHALLPEDQANALINFARDLVNQNRAADYILGGSRTAENTAQISDALRGLEEIAGNPVKGTARKVARTVDNARTKKLYGEVSDVLLSDPKELKSVSAPVPVQQTKPLDPKVQKILDALGRGNVRPVIPSTASMDQLLKALGY